MRSALAACLAVLVVTAAGCGDGGSTGSTGQPGTTGPTGTDDGVPWPTTSAPLPTDVLTWALDDEIHVGSDVVLDAGTAIESYVVAGDSAWVVTDDDTLLRVTSDGAEDTGTELDRDTLRASPDGRYLAFVDAASGEPDDYDTALLETVVVDLEQGTETVRSSEGMGDPGSDDLADLYEDAEHGVLGMTDAEVYVSTPTDGVLAVDLAEGTMQPVDESAASASPPWDAPRLDDDPEQGPSNADGTWAIDISGRRPTLVSASGQRVDPASPARGLLLARWLDTSTVVGFTSDDPLGGNAVQDPASVLTLVTCTVPDGTCTDVPDASGARGDLLLPTPALN